MAESTPSATELYQKIYKWYYEPGEVVRSIGFYMNPYKSYDQATFRHVFAFDTSCNFYVAQFSIYKQHIDSIFEIKNKYEHGMIFPVDCPVKPETFEELCQRAPVVEFEFLESKNIAMLNKRLRLIAQRLVDYGMPPETYLVSKKIDLWYLTIKNVLKDKYMQRPPVDYLTAKISKNN